MAGITVLAAVTVTFLNYTHDDMTVPSELRTYFLFPVAAELVVVGDWWFDHPPLVAMIIVASGLCAGFLMQRRMAAQRTRREFTTSPSTTTITHHHHHHHLAPPPPLSSPPPSPFISFWVWVAFPLGGKSKIDRRWMTVFVCRQAAAVFTVC
jgi:hypothetical protein